MRPASIFAHTGALHSDYRAVAKSKDAELTNRELSQARAMPFRERLKCIAQGHQLTFEQNDFDTGTIDKSIESNLQLGLAHRPTDRIQTMSDFTSAWRELAAEV